MTAGVRKQALIDKPWVRWLLVFGVWTLIGLSQATRFFFSSVNFGRQVAWSQAISYSLSDWYVVAVLSMPVIWLSRWFHLDRSNWRRNALVHLCASAAFSLVWLVVRAGVRVLLGADTFAHAFNPLFLRMFPFNFPIYWVILAVCHALDYYRAYHERELRTSELETLLAQAKLQALRMQLNPHFLFNALNSIATLMHKDVEAADAMLIRLSDLLRHTLDSADTHEVPLREELEFLERYLEIERTRFGQRLKVQMDIAPDTLDALVPNLALQPLVENAIKHGLEPRARPGLIQLRAWRERDLLQLQVQDDGVGLPKDRPVEEGVGFSNTRARLQQLYGEAHRFMLADAPGGGLVVRVTIPYRRETDETQASELSAPSPGHEGAVRA
jgi:two-component system LytT family sensor kinase